MKLYAKSRTISLIVGLIFLILILPGIASAASSPNAQYISDTIPATMNAGQSYTVSVTMKNTGTMTWNEASRIRLGGIGDGTGDAAKFGPARIYLPKGTDVLPGAQYTFTFTMTAPVTAGSYTPKYQMVWELHQWFGTQAPQPIQVINQVSSYSVPSAQFTASSTQGKYPLKVQFTDTSVSTGTTLYKWDVNNDGKTEYTTKNPSHIYTTAGTYSVRLTVTNTYGSNTRIKTNYITVTSSATTPAPTPTAEPAKLPTAQFTAGTTSGKAPLAVQFTDKSVSTGTTTYKWDVNNDGKTDYTTKSPSHTYTAAGTYTVKLTVTNASGSDSEIKTGYITTTATTVVTATGVYGAAANPTGNPIGGGAGYTRIISQTDSRVKYVVSTAAQLIAALKTAKSGEVVFIKGSAVIDMTANPAITIPAGVTLASDRGLSGSSGALIKRTKNVNGGWSEPIFIAGGNNVRLTGVRLEGEMYAQDYGNKAGETYEQDYLVGIYAKARTGFEVDNCELRGFAWSAVVSDSCVLSNVHHNYIHHNQARGEGYGVALYGGTSLIEANIFDYNRHSITGTGWAGEGYEARYNIVLGNGNPIGGHHFDVHQDERGGSFAGNLYKIHHNTFKNGNGKMASIAIRQRPVTGIYIDHNVFETISNATNGGVPIWERDSTQNMFATNNMWMGKLYPTNSGIVWFV
ncbi:MAG: PKD domain-containing protein [Methanoregula sp.]|jgi:PKD repeat protein